MKAPKNLRIVTHNGNFHCDDVFAVAMLCIALGKDIEVLRTRDPEEIAAADIVVDVGGMYNESAGRFDHHQTGGAGMRANGIPFASAGLVWKKYGKQICSGGAGDATGNTNDVSERIATMLDTKLVAPIDAHDNGMNLTTPTVDGVRPYLIQDIMGVFIPTWKEDSAALDTMFSDMVLFAQKLLEREIVVARDKIEGEAEVRASYEGADDKRLIILNGNYPWFDVVMAHPEPLYVIYRDPVNDFWKLRAVRQSPFTFKNRKDLPAAWGGKRDEEFVRATGVSDAVFCHNKLFLAVAKSKEGAIALAKQALESK